MNGVTTIKKQMWVPVLLLALVFGSTIAAFAAPTQIIGSTQLFRGRWNSVTFIAQPQPGEILTSFSFSSELPISRLPQGCTPLNRVIPVRSVTCTIKPGTMSVTLSLFVQENELKQTNNFSFRIWYKSAQGAVSEVYTTRNVVIRNNSR